MRITKSISNHEWVWFAKFGGLKTNFFIAFPKGRCIEIGVGYAPNGIPRGTRKLLTEPGVVSFYGFNSIYAKVADHNGLCPVSIFPGANPKQLPDDFGF